jgi:parallel beta-helix repeat protein
VSILALKAEIQPVSAELNTITVPTDYPTIQEALNSADPGDIVYVLSGTYYEHLKINKPLTLLGESKENTIIDGKRENQTIIEVTANNAIISEFTVQNSSRVAGSSYSGIKVSSNDCNITSNIVAKTKIGIFVISQRSRITENTVQNNGQGIALHSSKEVTVEANNLSKNTVGISLALSSDNIVTNNRAENSTSGGHGITLSSNSHNNTIYGNELAYNFHGMWLSSSYNNKIYNNTIANNELLGIELASSSNNQFCHNNIINNPTPVRVDTGTPSESICTWDNGYPSGGNYWHKHIDIDEMSGVNQDQPGSDKIWDNPYNIDKNNKDNYPTVKSHCDISHLLIAQAGSDKTVTVGTTVSFNASESTGKILIYEWDFGDETIETGVTPTHKYSKTGTYTVTLTIKDAAGNSVTDQLNVTVNPDNTDLISTYQPIINTLAVVTIIVMIAAIFWKRKTKTEKKRRPSRHR